MNAHIFTIGTVIIGLVAFASYLAANDPLTNLKNNTGVNLYCEFNNGERKVEKDLIVAFDGERWFFTNGSAVNCRVIDEEI